MGFSDRLKGPSDPASDGERWARILWVGPRVGAMVELQLEVHQSGAEPWVTNQTTLVPLQVRPQVGETLSFAREADGPGAYVALEWDR